MIINKEYESKNLDMIKKRRDYSKSITENLLINTKHESRKVKYERLSLEDFRKTQTEKRNGFKLNRISCDLQGSKHSLTKTSYLKFPRLEGLKSEPIKLSEPRMKENNSLLSLNSLKSYVKQDNSDLKSYQSPKLEKNNFNEIKPSEQNDLKSLMMHYEIGHIDPSNHRRSYLNNLSNEDKINFFKKFSISNKLTDTEKAKIISEVRNSHASNLNPYVSITNDTHYKDPIKSFEKLKVNKQIYEQILGIISNEQIEKYDSVYSKVENQKDKVIKLGNIKTKNIAPNDKKLNLNLSKSEDLMDFLLTKGGNKLLNL